MAWRAGNRQARSALRARSAAAANRLLAAKALCIQWARTAPRKLSQARPMTMPADALTSAMRAARAERQADAVLRSALRDAVSDDAEDADQREPERHGREDAKQYGEEPLAAVLCVALDGFVEGEGAVEAAGGDLLVGGDGCDSGADGVEVGERIALRADEELHVGPHQGGVRKVDGGDDGAIDAVVARIADDADDLTPGGALRRTGREAILKGENGNA